MAYYQLQEADYDRDTVAVARGLLGKYLVLRRDGVRVAGCITETEAYCGMEDKACHASKGRTPRTEVMFGPPGHWYVYLIYGMYHCLNIVTEPVDQPCAVLIRAVATVTGLEDSVKTDGPGKLCRAFGIDRDYNAETACGAKARLWIEDRSLRPSDADIQAGPRIGIHYAGVYRDKPWRFLLSASYADMQSVRL